MQQQQISDRFSAVMPGRRPGCAVQVLEQGAVPNTTIGTIPTIGFIGHDAQSGGNFIHHALSERCRRLLRDPLVYSAGVAVVETDERKVVTQARAKLVDNETVFCQAGDSDQVRGCPSAALGHVCRVRQCVIVRSPVLGIRQMVEMPITGKNEYSAKQGSTGLPEGWLEGLLEGLLEGFLDGLTLGTRLGLELGTWLGFLVPTSVRKLHPRNFGSGSYVVSSAKLHRKFHLLNRAVGTYGSVRCRAARNRAIFKLSCEWFCRFATLKRFNHGGSAIFFCQQGGTLFLEFCSCSSFFGR